MQRQCRYGNKCWNLQACKYHHSNSYNTFINSKLCRYGKKCRNQPYCKFNHTQTNIPELDLNQQKSESKNIDTNMDTKSEPDTHQLNQNVIPIKTLYTYSQKTFHNDTEHNFQYILPQKSSITLMSKQDEKIIKNVQIKEENEVKQFNCLNLIHQGQQQYLQHILQQFFNVRLVKSNKFDAIYSLVEDNVSLENLHLLIQQIVKIQESEFGPHFTYLKIVKTIIQKGMDFAAVCDKLQKQMKIKLLKQQKNTEFLLKIPNPIDYKVLTQIELLNISQQQHQASKSIIIDGDNVLNSHKIFRKYYKSKNNNKVAQGQIRLRWLLSEIQNCLLFFDCQMVSHQVYDDIANRIMYQEEVQNYGKQVWEFANLYVGGLGEEGEEGEEGDGGEEGLQDVDEEQEQENECINDQQDNSQNRKTADQQILVWLNKKTQNNQEPPCQILLVTGDRLLIQHCLQKKPQTQISSGKHFIKYCKQMIRRKYYGNKIKKGVIKRIFTSPHI